MKKIIENIAKYVIDRNGKIELQEAYEYSFQILIETVITIVTNLIMAIAFGRFWEYIVFILVFLSVRNYAGGIHLNTFWGCFILTNTVVVIILTVSGKIPLNSFTNVVIIVVLSCLLLIRAPIDTPNRRLNIEEKAIMSRKLKRNLLFINIIVILFMILSENTIIIVVRNTICIAFLSCLAGWAKNKYLKATDNKEKGIGMISG
jgi:Membrane protein putatively involved in post-translational modification of the autoinducing quorum-sensing peptide